MSELTGQILAHRYRVENFLGRGGMAEVYKVWDQERATYLAMKLLREDLAQDPIFIRRFKREAQTLAKLQHPNIVRFYGLDQDDLLAFMLMDYVNGTSLRAEIFRSQGKPFSNEKILEVISPICSALHYAHRQGMVHCDVKPGNILIDKSGHVLVSDFGIARMSESATATMVGVGTPAYMAPEQARGENPTPQTDIYSLGVVLFEMLTGGERPFTGESAQITGSTSDKIRWEQMNLKPPSLRKVNPNVSPELEAIIQKCLKKEPDLRYKNTIEFVSALEVANENQPTLAQKKGPAWRQAVERPPQSKRINTPEILPSQGRKRRGAIVISILLIGILIVIGIVLGSGAVIGPLRELPTIPTSSILPVNTLTLTNTPLTPATAFIFPSKAITAQVIVSSVYLHEFPETTSVPENPKQYAKGEIMTVLGQDPSGQWFQVKAPDGQIGWLYKDWLSLFTDELTSIPTTTIIASLTPAPFGASALCVVQVQPDGVLAYYLEEFGLIFNSSQSYYRCTLDANSSSCTSKNKIDLNSNGNPILHNGDWLVMPVASQVACISPGIWVMDASSP